MRHGSSVVGSSGSPSGGYRNWVAEEYSVGRSTIHGDPATSSLEEA
jgi:hypothetical protein